MSDSIPVNPATANGRVNVLTKLVDEKHTPIYASGVTSVKNSTETLLTNGSAFTGEWEDVGHHNNVVVSVKTDQNATYSVQFSTNGVDVDSTLTRYYRTNQINVPHKFTITRRYCRVVFTNDSGSDQTYLRLQTLYGDKGDLNVPLDSVIAQDYDSISTRPSDFWLEAGIGRRQGYSIWNKFGYNSDIDTGTEIVAAFGGTFTPSETASTLTIVSANSNDTSGGTGVNSIVIYGIDSNWNEAIEVVTMNGVTPVVTTSSWIGINRVAVYLSGSLAGNAGLITITKTTGGSTLAAMPVGESVTQQCLLFIPQNTTFAMEWALFSAARQASQNPYVLFKGWVYSSVNKTKQLVFRQAVETAVENHFQLSPKTPFPVGEKSIFWIEATTDKDNTDVSARFSGVFVRDVDG